MKTKVYCVLLCVLMIGLFIPSVLAQYDEDDSWVSSTESTGDGDDDGDWVNGGSIDDDDYDSTYDPEDSPGYSLFIGIKLYCHLDDRDDENRFVVYESSTQYGHIFTSHYESEDDLWPLLPYTSTYTLSNGLFDLTDDDGYDRYVWRDTLGYPGVSIPLISSDEFENAKIHRYEGRANEDYNEWENYGCIPFIGLLNTVNFLSEDKVGFDLKARPIEANSDGSLPIYAYYADELGQDIIWDENEEQCEAIGGDWLEESDAPGFTSGGAYRCCGDDRMWIENRAINEDGFPSTISDGEREDVMSGEESSSLFCLYGEGEIEAEYLSIDVPSSSTGYYTCSETQFDDYDDTLDLDDDYDALEKPETRETAFFFKGVEDNSETDVGKWSNYDDLDPHFCYYSWDDSQGETYQWIDNINELGDMPVNDEGEELEIYKDVEHETICESYLGGTWTGGYCCGNKYNYPGDAWNIGDEDAYFGESFSDTTPIYYEGSSTVHTNYVCVQGEVLNTLETTWFETDDTTLVEVLNVDGNMHACNYDQLTADGYDLGEDYYLYISTAANTELVQEDYQIESCAVVEETYLCTHNPDAADEGQYEWQWYHITSGDEGDYVSDTLRYSSGDEFALSDASEWADEDGDGVVDSDYTSLQACCAGSSCWDGNECLDEYTIHYYGDDNDGDGIEDDVAICQGGEWQIDVEPKYDWYHNTDSEAIDYCANGFSCICSSNDDDDTFCTENEDYVAGGCTLVENFYKDDHLCEALDTNGDGVYDDSSVWTSRTKILAFQMLEIATNVGDDFTLFCDTYENAVNNYAELESVDNINNVCILRQGEQTIFGVTLNWEDDDEPMIISEEALAEILEEGSDGLLDDAFEADVTDCSATLGETHTYRFGDYHACDSTSTTVYYNDLLNTIIYAQDGMDSTTYSGTTLYYPGEQSGIDWQGFVDAYQTTLWDTYLSSGSYDIYNPDETDLWDYGYFDAFEHVADYSSFYYRYADGQSIFGFEEIKYSEVGEDNRYYMGVIYNGYDIDCEQIYAPYEETWAISCNTDISGFDIVLERSTSRSEHWNDLTAAIRSLYE